MSGKGVVLFFGPTEMARSFGSISNTPVDGVFSFYGRSGRFFFVCVRSFPSFLLFIFGVCLDGRLGQPVIRHRAPPVALVGQNRRSDHRAVFLAKKLADDAVVMQVNILGWQPPSCTQKSTKKTRKGPITVAGMPSERRLTTGGRRSGGGDFASKSEEFHSPV